MTTLRRSLFKRWIALSALLLLFAAPILFSTQLPRVKPVEVGFSADRLERLSGYLQAVVDQGRAAGVVALVARKGRIPYLKSFGKLDRETGVTMPADAIFRIASQTKAVTSVAVMMLHEEGKFLLDDPISKYLPEFAGARVAVQSPDKDARGYTTVPVKRPITIRDLLTHTAGISYGDGPARDAYLAAGIQGWRLADKTVPTI